MSAEGWTGVTVTVRNGFYRGRYRVEAGRVVVCSARGSVSARLGALPAAVVAEALLCELAAAGLA